MSDDREENEKTNQNDSEKDVNTVSSTAGRVNAIDLEKEMQRSYLDYAMSVIVGRALPDVRDGMKPVHRRILYTMYYGGFRPQSAFHKSAAVVGDVLGKFHPHGDTAVYDALVRLVQPWSLRYPLVDGQGNFGSPGNLGPAAQRYTECRMKPLAMEMVRDIDENTVDFMDNYDGRFQEPTVLPSRFPQLLCNGSEGIAVGMATRIPPHNLKEVAEGVQWYLKNPTISREELMEGLIERISGPDFPTGATILGRKGIENMYRTGHGSIVQRAVVEVETIQNRTCLVVTELPYQVNPDNLAAKIAQLVKDGSVQGIADIRDETSSRSGQRLVIVLKRDAVAKVVLNNLYKRTQLQDSFPANMLALVDGVPRTLSLDGFVRHWVSHQMDVIKRRTAFRLAKTQERLHILEGYLKALDALDEVISLIRRSQTPDQARQALIDFLDIDEVQANAILSLQLRRLAALERQKIVDEHAQLQEQAKDLQDILDKPERQRWIIGEELQEIVDKYGDERRTQIVPFHGDMSEEDLVPERDVVVTITHGGYIKSTPIDQYRAQKRGGKGVRGAQLRKDDIIEHFFTTTTHHWLLFFTNKGRVYRVKTYELPAGGRDSKGQHLRNFIPFQPDEVVAQVLDICDYDQADYLVLATQSGLVKKSRLRDYDSKRVVGISAIVLKELPHGKVDHLVSAVLCNADDDLLLVSHKGSSIRFRASDDSLRPTSRATSGVIGMRFRPGDSLLALDVVKPSSDLFVVTENGYAKRTAFSKYHPQARGGQGVKVANLGEKRGDLVSALSVEETDEVMVITNNGKVIRSRVSDVPQTGRTTVGVIFARLTGNDKIIAVARNQEHDIRDEADNVDTELTPDTEKSEAPDEGAAEE